MAQLLVLPPLAQMKEGEQDVFGAHYTQQMHKNIKEGGEGNEMEWVWTSCLIKTNDELACAMANALDLLFPALANK